MYSYGGSVGNYQYLIQDLLYTTVLASVMGFTRPAKRLSKARPPERLMSLGIWLPVLLQFACCAAFQLGALLLLTRQPWYARFDPHPDGTNCFDRTQANSAVCSQSYENSTVFLVSLGQFLIAAFVFNKGPPFRRPIYTNLWLLLAMSFQTLLLGFLILAPSTPVTHDFAGEDLGSPGPRQRACHGGSVGLGSCPAPCVPALKGRAPTLLTLTLPPPLRPLLVLQACWRCPWTSAPSSACCCLSTWRSPGWPTPARAPCLSGSKAGACAGWW